MTLPFDRMNIRRGTCRSFPRGPRGSPFPWNELDPIRRVPEFNRFMEFPIIPFFLKSLSNVRRSSLAVEILSSPFFDSLPGEQELVVVNRLSAPPNRFKEFPTKPFFRTSSGRSPLVDDVKFLSSFFFSSSEDNKFPFFFSRRTGTFSTNGSTDCGRPSTPTRLKCSCREVADFKVRNYTKYLIYHHTIFIINPQ